MSSSKFLSLALSKSITKHVLCLLKKVSVRWFGYCCSTRLCNISKYFEDTYSHLCNLQHCVCRQAHLKCKAPTCTLFHRLCAVQWKRSRCFPPIGSSRTLMNHTVSHQFILKSSSFAEICLGFRFLSFIFYVFFTTKLVFGKAWLAFSCSTANRFNTTSWHSCLAFAYPGRFLYDATELLKPSVPGATFSFKIFAAVQLFLPTAGHVTVQLPHRHLEHLGIKETRNVTSVSVTFRLCY